MTNKIFTDTEIQLLSIEDQRWVVWRVTFDPTGPLGGLEALVLRNFLDFPQNWHPDNTVKEKAIELAYERLKAQALGMTPTQFKDIVKGFLLPARQAELDEMWSHPPTVL